MFPMVYNTEKEADFLHSCIGTKTLETAYTPNEKQELDSSGGTKVHHAQIPIAPTSDNVTRPKEMNLLVDPQ